eukprot:CAMPEP_0173300414 /NCGR_PEP_ID=MMETSP1143-20121109/17214_1 /TAXON_ID=483371 /ORGANISM="non described non described, Strain CCMP2298" /LENGTH=71 /DNA_ID=CAMNT_0014240797 /DNA_START=100 /DNA_END=312 /DNA_ORIENTATION=+
MPNRFKALAVLFTDSTKAASFSRRLLPRKKSLILSPTVPTGFQVFMSMSTIPGVSERWWYPYPSSMCRPQE